MNITKYLITSGELVKLISFVGSDKDVSDTKRIIGKIGSWMLILWLIYLIIYLLFSAYILDISYHFISSSIYFPILIALLMIYFVFSLIENIKIFNSSITFEVKIHNKLMGVLIKYLDKSDKRLISDFQDGFNKYYFNLFNVGLDLIGFSVMFITALASNTPIEFKIVVSIVILFLALSVLILGKYWIFISRKSHENLVEGGELHGALLFKRVLIPAGFNLSSGFAVPLILILLSKYSMNTLIVQVALIGSMVSFGWTLISTLEKFGIAKSKLSIIIDRMNLMQERYVINRYGFSKLCEKTKPNDLLLETARRNKSLVLDKYIPMAFTNSGQKEPSHQYNYEFKPGLYQLNGLNGVGKTTLLKSLTLPEGVLVEISSGGVAFCGKPFFNCDESLEEHREEFRYIGAESLQSDVNKLNLALFTEYPLIMNFIQNSIRNANELQSEGEKGVISIAKVYQDCRNGVNEGLVFIDEILSRIYGKPDFPLRQEIVRMLSDMLKIDDTLIIIIVDHVTHAETAKQLRLEKKLIQCVEK